MNDMATAKRPVPGMSSLNRVVRPRRPISHTGDEQRQAVRVRGRFRDLLNTAIAHGEVAGGELGPLTMAAIVRIAQEHATPALITNAHDSFAHEYARARF